MFEPPVPSPSGLPIPELAGAIATESGQIAAAQCRMLLKLAELDAREDNGFWTDCKSAAHWLAGRCGYDMSTSWEMVRVARRLVRLPVIAEAFGKGRLAYPQVRALARIATAETEADMVEMVSIATGAQLERIVASYRRVLASYADPKAPFAGRELHYHFDADGFFCFKGRLSAEAGTVLRQAIEAAAEELRAETKRCDLADVADDQPPGRAAVPAAANRADALVALAETSLARGLEARAGSERTQVIVHVSAETLSGTRDGERCEIEDGAEIAPETARRLACDAVVVSLVESASGEPLSVGRKTRKVNPALDRAVRCRDKACTFPGCGQPIFLDNHHIEHWARGGETSLVNLIKLCGWHHGLVHEGGYNVVRDPETRALVFTRPDGSVVDNPRMATGPHDGQLNFGVDLFYNDRRDGTERVEYDDIMRYFARFDSRLPKEPPQRPPDLEPGDPPEDQQTS